MYNVVHGASLFGFQALVFSLDLCGMARLCRSGLPRALRRWEKRDTVAICKDLWVGSQNPGLRPLDRASPDRPYCCPHAEMRRRCRSEIKRCILGCRLAGSVLDYDASIPSRCAKRGFF